jgi:hypothetical protein
MEKGRGYALSAVLAAAVLLRPAGPFSAQQTPGSDAAKTEAASAATQEPSDGPWIASCNYWAPVRDQAIAPPAEPQEISGKLGEKPLTLHLPAQDSSKRRELGCSAEVAERWGLPQSDSVHVTAMIATVPNPVHTHLALSFDRAIDAILQAATDNGYVSSYYWTPWKSRGGASRAGETQTEMEAGHDPERERQPGLIILKHVRGDKETRNYADDFYQ